MIASLKRNNGLHQGLNSPDQWSTGWTINNARQRTQNIPRYHALIVLHSSTMNGTQGTFQRPQLNMAMNRDLIHSESADPPTECSAASKIRRAGADRDRSSAWAYSSRRWIRYSGRRNDTFAMPMDMSIPVDIVNE
jgi:hypothetical protein